MGKKIDATLNDLAEVTFDRHSGDATKEMITYVQRFVDHIGTKLSDLYRSLSFLDKAVDRILHDIEQEDFNAARGYAIAKKLQNLRKERRKVKAEIKAMETLFAEFKDKQKNIRTACRVALAEINSYETYVGLKKPLTIPVTGDQTA